MLSPTENFAQELRARGIVCQTMALDDDGCVTVAFKSEYMRAIKVLCFFRMKREIVLFMCCTNLYVPKDKRATALERINKANLMRQPICAFIDEDEEVVCTMCAAARVDDAKAIHKSLDFFVTNAEQTYIDLAAIPEYF